MSSCTKNWLEVPIKGVLMDITGVLYDSGQGDGRVIDGSLKAVQLLRSAGVPFRFLSNETHHSRVYMVERFKRLGFQIRFEELFTPAPACANILKERGLRPHFLVYPNVLSEFDGIDQSNPNCVVIGDAGNEFSYANVNKAFQFLINTDSPVLLSMGCGKYYKETDGFKLDVGAYAKALEYACDVKAEFIGKPSPSYFNAPLKDMNLQASEVVMIGDDLISDVGGAQKCGMRGVQVKTGKWRDHWANHPDITPDAIVDNLLSAIQSIVTSVK